MSVVHYQFNFLDLSARILTINLTFTPKQSEHLLTLPAWIPGSYLVRNFARHIITISAKDAAGPLALHQQDKQSWLLACNADTVTVTYQVYANDLSVRAAYIDDELAVLNPACLCLAVSDLTQQPQQIQLCPPAQRVTKPWRVGTALPRMSDTQPLGFGNYLADNYEHLIDSPIVIGHFSLQQFAVAGVPHYLVVTGENLFDETRLVNDLSNICHTQRDVFGGLPEDLNQYWFLLWVTEQGYGGLEHQFSTLLLCNRYDLPTQNTLATDSAYQNLLGLCSHEYFHTWWVKRLKPSCFTPYQLDKEQYSRQLWIYEGFTSYFDDLALVKSGLISQSNYLTVLEKLISRVSRNHSNAVQSLADSSFTAWTKFYMQDENAVNSIVSYYAKGALVALLLEAALRQHGYSLAELCRMLYQQYIATGTHDDSIYCVLKTLHLPDLASTLSHWVNTASALPLAEYLPLLGLTLQWRSPQDINDISGNTNTHSTAHLGCSTKSTAGMLTVHQLHHGSAAHQAGVMSGDQLLALAGYKITEQTLSQLLTRLPLGSVQELTVFRKDRLLTLSITMQTAAATVAMLIVSDQQKCTQWLKANTEKS